MQAQGSRIQDRKYLLLPREDKSTSIFIQHFLGSTKAQLWINSYFTAIYLQSGTYMQCIKVKGGTGMC